MVKIAPGGVLAGWKYQLLLSFFSGSQRKETICIATKATFADSAETSNVLHKQTILTRGHNFYPLE